MKSFISRVHGRTRRGWHVAHSRLAVFLSLRICGFPDLLVVNGPHRHTTRETSVPPWFQEHPLSRLAPAELRGDMCISRGPIDIARLQTPPQSVARSLRQPPVRTCPACIPAIVCRWSGSTPSTRAAWIPASWRTPLSCFAGSLLRWGPSEPAENNPDSSLQPPAPNLQSQLHNYRPAVPRTIFPSVTNPAPFESVFRSARDPARTAQNVGSSSAAPGRPCGNISAAPRRCRSG